VSNDQSIHDEEILLKDAFDTLGSHFVDQEGFLAEYERIPNASLKNRFLRLTSTYKSLVKDGSFSVPGDQVEASGKYIDVTYKFIALISIIEAIFSKDEWLDFYQWLSKSQNAHVFPITDQTELKLLYKQYKSEYGAIRNTIKFFGALELDAQEFLKSKLVQFRPDNKEASEIDSTIPSLAKLLYRIRSEFMHKAKLIVEFSDVPAITINREGKPFISNLSLGQLMRIFEVGLLKQFRMRPERKNLFL